MARDVSEGYVLLNPTMMKRMTDEELRQLRFEIERLLTGIRGEQYPADDTNAVQNRNRRIGRLTSGVSMINNYLQSRH